MNSTSQFLSQPRLSLLLLVMALFASEFFVATWCFQMPHQNFRSRHVKSSIYTTPSPHDRRLCIQRYKYSHSDEVHLQLPRRATQNNTHIYEFSSTPKNKRKSKRALQRRKRKWVEDSTRYYTTMMRHKSRKARGRSPIPEFKEKAKVLEYHRKNFVIAQNLYFARNQIKVGNLSYAESIYRKLVNEMIEADSVNESDSCKNAHLAVSTLLLCLLLQRKNQIKETRAAFVQFSRIISENAVVDCTCSAKVLQAFALFEMKQGHVRKSYELIKQAVQMDNELEPVLSWRQFRDAKALTLS